MIGCFEGVHLYGRREVENSNPFLPREKICSQVFAMGQVYVLVFKGKSHIHPDPLGEAKTSFTTHGNLIVPSKVSRVTDPKNF